MFVLLSSGKRRHTTYLVFLAALGLEPGFFLVTVVFAFLTAATIFSLTAVAFLFLGAAFGLVTPDEKMVRGTTARLDRRVGSVGVVGFFLRPGPDLAAVVAEPTVGAIAIVLCFFEVWIIGSEGV